MQKSSRAKFFRAFLAMIGTALFLFLGWKIYLTYSENAPDLINDAVKQYEEKDYAKAMADTYGGKTPQETLQLYITAVERGDYALASKYLIEENRDHDQSELRALASKGNLDSFLEIIKKAQLEGEITSDSVRMESATKSGTSYFIRFKKYPNGVWKIIEI